MKKKLDWSKLPEHLRYLAAPAEKYGSIQFEDRIMDFWEKVSDADKKELQRVDEKTLKDEDEIKLWYRKLDITKQKEARLVYFLLHLLGLGNDNGYLPIEPIEK